MSVSCRIDRCKRQSCALCYCCNKNVCFNHLKEHHELLHSQILRLVNDVNDITDQFMALSVKILIQKLDNESADEKQVISRLDEPNKLTYRRYFVKQIDKIHTDLDQLRSKMTERICEQDTTNIDIHLFTLTIRHLEREIEKIDHQITHGDYRSALIDQLIPIRMLNMNELNLSTFTDPFQIIICTNPFGSALASNNRHLLMDQRLNIHVFDQDLTLKQRYQWKYGFVRDMCWSSTLVRFILITNTKKLFLVNDDMTSVVRIQIDQDEDWCSCTCSDTSLFLTTNNRGNHILEFNLSTLFPLIQQWQSSHLCQKDEFIHDIVYNHQTLALIIEDCFTHTMRLELRSSTTFNLIWSFQTEIQCNLFQPAIRCCSLKSNHWLIIDSNNSRLFHITDDGQMKSSYPYKSSPWNALLIDSNTIAIRTEYTLDFHRIY